MATATPVPADEMPRLAADLGRVLETLLDETARGVAHRVSAHSLTPLQGRVLRELDRSHHGLRPGELAARIGQERPATVSAVSALRHAHSRQDEFIYVLSGTPTLYTDEGATVLQPGMCAGFRSGTGNAHRLVNASDQEAVYLEVGDRSAGDSVHYPDDDLAAHFVDGAWVFSHKDGKPY